MSPEWQEPLSSAPMGKVAGGGSSSAKPVAGSRMGSGYPVGGQRCVGGMLSPPCGDSGGMGWCQVTTWGGQRSGQLCRPPEEARRSGHP